MGAKVKRQGAGLTVAGLCSLTRLSLAESLIDILNCAMSSQMGEPPVTLTVETIRIYADFSIRRACGFALLGVSCLMFAFAFDMRQAFHVGAILVAMIAIVLWLKGLRAPRKPYFQTELWIMLPERPRMTKAELQRLIGGILAERFWWHAKAAAIIAVAFAAVALLIWLKRLL